MGAALVTSIRFIYMVRVLAAWVGVGGKMWAVRVRLGRGPVSTRGVYIAPQSAWAQGYSILSRGDRFVRNEIFHSFDLIRRMTLPHGPSSFLSSIMPVLRAQRSSVHVIADAFSSGTKLCVVSVSRRLRLISGE